jgi:tetratricopeptide (TPR) repeat protein
MTNRKRIRALWGGVGAAALLFSWMLAGASPARGQDGPANAAADAVDASAMNEGPAGLNSAQQARMRLSSGNRAAAQAEKFDAKASAEKDPKKQEELRAKAKKQFEAAIVDYQEALKQDPKLVEAYVGLAGLMIKAGRIEQSIETLEVALKVDPASLKALAARGRAQLAAFKVDDAKATYDRIAAESAKDGKGFLAEMRAWLEAQRAKLGPEMKQAVEDLDRWIHEREGT